MPRTRGLRASAMPVSPRELVPGAVSLLQARSGGKCQLYPGEKNRPLAQNLNVKGKSAPCITWY